MDLVSQSEPNFLGATFDQQFFVAARQRFCMIRPGSFQELSHGKTCTRDTDMV
jgi:hypothetical protein